MASYTIKNWVAYQGKFQVNANQVLPVCVISGDIYDTSTGVSIDSYGASITFDPSVGAQLNGIVAATAVLAYNDDTLVDHTVSLDYSANISSLTMGHYNFQSQPTTSYTVVSHQYDTPTAYFGTDSLVSVDLVMGIRNSISATWNDTLHNYTYIPIIYYYNNLNNRFYVNGRDYTPGYPRYGQCVPLLYFGSNNPTHYESGAYYAITLDNLYSIRERSYITGYLSYYADIDLMLKDRLTMSTPTSDPYSDGGTSGTGGGKGSFDGTGDAISVPSVPTLGATNTGLVTLYNPTLAQVQSLASYMWSDSFSLDSFKKLFADPMDAILGLSIVPVAVPDGSAQNLKVGNIDTGISMTLAGSQYVTVDCGSLAVNEYWGAYLDYSPYTKAEIYLPYIGMHTLSADDIMGKTVSVKYNVDILSGSCIAFVSCGDSVLYTFSGACAQNLPITGNDFAQNFAGALTLCTSTAALAAGAATGGALAAPAAGMVSSAIQATKGNVQRSGSIGGTAGMLGVQVPYLVLTRPRQCVPGNQNCYQGYPAYITENLADLSGYTEVESIQLENCTATDSEIDEIKSLLAAGVLL